MGNGKGHIGNGYKYLFQRISEEGSFDRFLAWAVFLYRTSHWSLFNSALAYIQRNGCVCLKSEKDWEKIGRTVKSSATPIVIMQPFGPVTFVYDFADTEGENVPIDLQRFNEFIEPPLQPISEVILGNAKEICPRLGVKYYERSMGAGQCGESQIRKNRMYYGAKSSKKRKIGWYEIVINSNCNATSKVTTIFHELGHILCGHLPLDKEKRKENSLKVPDRTDDHLDPSIEEWEAEKVCEVTCRMLGLEYDSRAYLSEYGYGSLFEKKTGSARLVLDAADKIIRLLESTKKEKRIDISI